MSLMSFNATGTRQAVFTIFPGADDLLQPYTALAGATASVNFFTLGPGANRIIRHVSIEIERTVAAADIYASLSIARQPFTGSPTMILSHLSMLGLANTYSGASIACELTIAPGDQLMLTAMNGGAVNRQLYFHVCMDISSQ